MTVISLRWKKRKQVTNINDITANIQPITETDDSDQALRGLPYILYQDASCNRLDGTIFDLDGSWSDSELRVSF